MEAWGPDRAGDLAALIELALPGEGLSAAELRFCCWDDPGVVLTFPDGTGAVAAVVRSWNGYRAGYVKVLAVEPEARRGGRGRALLEAAETWAFDEGAGEVRLGGSAPFYLWPGVDTLWTPALCLAEACGYHSEGVSLNMACSAGFRAEPAPEVEVGRASEVGMSTDALALAREHFPHWVTELERAVDLGTAFLAVDRDSGATLGFACHSVNRAGWIGPMATDPSRQGRGVGAALLGALCADLAAAGHQQAEIAWVGPLRFYAKTAGAVVSRVFATLVKRKT